MSEVPTRRSVAIDSERDIVTARQEARRLAGELGFSSVDQSRIATAVSELARNVVRHAEGGRGRAELRAIESPEHRQGIEIVISDEGPGLADIEQAMTVGFSSGSGYGLGLPGAKRLMDEMEVNSAAGSGTVITIRKWRGR